MPDSAAALERNMREDQQLTEQTMKVWCLEDGNVGISRVNKSMVSFWCHYCGQRGKDLQSGGESAFAFMREGHTGVAPPCSRSLALPNVAGNQNTNVPM